MQVTEVLFLALRCTERDPRKRPTMKDVILCYQKRVFKLSCDDVVYAGAEVAVDVAPQPYNVSSTQGDYHLHGESSRAASLRHMEVTFNVETEPKDSYDLNWWPFANQLDVSTNLVSNTQGDYHLRREISEAANLRHIQVTFNVETEPDDSNYTNRGQDANQYQHGFYAWYLWKLVSTPTACIDGLIVQLIGSGKIQAEQVLATALIVPKVTYSWPYLIFLPSVTGPVVTEPFNWFFLSCWAQYMHQQKSLKSQLNSHFITTTNQGLLNSVCNHEEFRRAYKGNK